MAALTTTEFERAITWNLTIAVELLGRDLPFQDEGKERYWSSGFHVCRQSGAWYSWATAKGHISSLELIKFLRPAYTHEDAVLWLTKFLATHAGVGLLEAEDDEWTKTRKAVVAGLARHYLDIAEPLPADGLEVAYLISRGLPGPYPEALRRVPNPRPGESALLMPLVAYERITGVLLTYIDGLGKKSLEAPSRRRFDLERASGAVMEIAAATPGTVDISTDVVTCEGLENGLSINLVKSPAWRILALPGINTLKHVTLKPEERRVIFFQDSDPAGHPARKGLEAGVDALLLAEKDHRIFRPRRRQQHSASRRARGEGAEAVAHQAGRCGTVL